MNRTSAARPAAAGFTLVEMMVALVIGLLATIIIMQMFGASEARKRTITGGGDAQTNAAVALYLMERDIRQAGYGLSPNTQDFVPLYTPPPAGVLTNGILAQCTTVRAYKKNRATTQNFVYTQSTFAPLVINPPGYPAGDANTDVILVNYSGTGGMIGNGIDITQGGGTNQGGGDVPDYVVVTTRAGFNQGDMILAVPPPGTGLDCTIGEITGLPVPAPPATAQCATGAVTGVTNEINHNDVAYRSVYTGCGAVNAAWNKPGAGISYNPGSRLYNLGPVGGFVSRVYAVRKGNLTMCDLTASDCTAAVADPPDGNVWTPIAAGVVALRAQYGKDTDFDGLVNTWEATPQLTGANRSQLVALRLAVVVRSNQLEKVESGVHVTAAAPVWHSDAAGTSDASITLSGTDWQDYRYKLAQSLVPLRNMIWGEQQ